jgi:hypothetical protein
MTITRLWQTGAETQSLDEFDSTGGNNISVDTSTKKTGNASYKMQEFFSSAYGDVNVSATRQLRVGFFFNPNNTIYAGAAKSILQLRASGGSELAAIYQTGSGGSSDLILKVAGVTQDTEVGANAGGDFFHLGIDVKIDSSSGWVSVYKDGIEILSASGNTGNSDIEVVRFTNPGISEYQYYDDMYIDDTTGEATPAPPPISRFYWLAPNGIGNYSDWTKSSGSDGYNLVDEVPPSDSDYVEADSVGEDESYNMDTLSLGANQYIKAVIPTVRADRAGGTEEIKLGARLSSTDLLGDSQPLPTSAGYLHEYMETKPGGGSWEQSDIDSFEILLQSAGSF